MLMLLLLPWIPSDGRRRSPDTRERERVVQDEGVLQQGGVVERPLSWKH